MERTCSLYFLFLNVLHLIIVYSWMLHLIRPKKLHLFSYVSTHYHPINFWSNFWICVSIHELYIHDSCDLFSLHSHSVSRVGIIRHLYIVLNYSSEQMYLCSFEISSLTYFIVHSKIIT